jgi:hypothetical protein
VDRILDEADIEDRCHEAEVLFSELYSESALGQLDALVASARAVIRGAAEVGVAAAGYLGFAEWALGQAGSVTPGTAASAMTFCAVNGVVFADGVVQLATGLSGNPARSILRDIIVKVMGGEPWNEAAEAMKDQIVPRGAPWQEGASRRNCWISDSPRFC